MILTVTHTTLYRYDAPVRGVVQSHRLTPSRFDGQQPRAWQVTVSGGIVGGGFRDGAGDWVQSHSVPGPVSEITVHVEGTVETRDTTGMLRGHREGIAPEVYLRKTAPTRPDAALAALAAAAVAGCDDRLDCAHRLSAAVSEAIAYRPGVTHAHTTAAEALALGEGVCQDHAHALIGAARAVGLPARYVSGYLMAAEDGTRHEAAHAWAEIWVEGLKCWVGFDAANRCCPDDRYIRLGSGLDARDAAPIRGSARGTGGESLDVTVAIQSVQQ
ncbi:transglutaminase family protein [Acidimangrovimonas pyrenivorans]|uniref:Transglutaminase domain-containing protein n=1 Tax=Acidimangrovimonas pyrenivorans TaxID=2030798 RepID=A0ABV7AGU9_9RHOB